MNKGLWIARKNHLWCLILRVSNRHGGDDPKWLKQYFEEILESHSGEKIEEVIACFSDLVERTKDYPECNVDVKNGRSY